MDTFQNIIYSLPWWIYFAFAIFYRSYKIPHYLKLDNKNLPKIKKDILNYGIQQLLVVGFYFLSTSNMDVKNFGLFKYYSLIFIPGSITILMLSGYIIDKMIMKIK
ncbi:hypothetical protein DCC35_13285 [Mangrovivirga cuniculi]|uniref:Uncharacterized protein n=1 Tax=Mangrovivirga cuniculi TaxID=2715131 RepID=A0A4D7JLX4_9BACT|nr:hypothetical protein DCC35_13285 [Mangrovivirga cuniculi]